MPAPAHRRPAQAPAPQPSGDRPAETRIAAVVNDKVISVADLQSRLSMVMLSSNFPDTEETRQRIASQVLRTIVDEKLQMQEAKHHRHR
jgi:peptidyl-prolyl cis-trans isomerase SurA